MDEVATIRTKDKISMSASGRLTIPRMARRALGITGETQLTVVVVDEGIVLRPLPPESDDRWAYLPRHREMLRRALVESQAGRTVAASDADLLVLAPVE